MLRVNPTSSFHAASGKLSILSATGTSASATKLILPAFGSLTGGLDAGHPEIIRAVGLDARALVPVADKMLSFPLAA